MNRGRGLQRKTPIRAVSRKREEQGLKGKAPTGLVRTSTLRAKPKPAEEQRKERKTVLAFRPANAVSVAATMNWAPNALQPAAVVVKLPKRADDRPRSEAESSYLGRVKQLPCVLCLALGLRQESPTDAHHVRVEQGGAQRAMDWLAAALCHGRCHQGTHGIHGDRSLLRQAKCTEIDLLGWTVALLNGGKVAA